ncbi:hypothetical protein B0J18DRAFT_432573 [Chaetomium sp. MPI-SDFR-AT-0129]|nr:hypothetical protein B0J18DRAFT_432573 [Chaetomium sp. MPI-SDFR-AT-0129]
MKPTDKISKTHNSLSTMENCKDTEPVTFPLFSRLPADIRQEIWRIACSQPAYTPSICFCPKDTLGSAAAATAAADYDDDDDDDGDNVDDDDDDDDEVEAGEDDAEDDDDGDNVDDDDDDDDEDDDDYDYFDDFPGPTILNLTVQEPANINILATNTEAHDIALVSPPITRPYNPARDILFLSPHGCDHFSRALYNPSGPAWVTEIRHLALGLSLTKCPTWLPRDRARLRSLQTLSIVYPEASGAIDLGTEVDPDPLLWPETEIETTSGVDPDTIPIPHPKSNQPLRLQRLTPTDLGALTIEADYMHETWEARLHVKWSKSASDHMAMVRQEWDCNCNPAHIGVEGPSPLWDYAANRLRVQCVATVFARRTGRGRFAG